MTGERTPPSRSRDGGTGEEERQVARLLALAGPRRAPPADVEARVRAATMSAFDALPDPAPGRWSWLSARPVGVALAASLLVALVAGWMSIRDGRAPIAGEIRFATGGYTVRGSETASSSVAAGSIVRTSAQGRLLIDLGAERDLRMDRSTSLTLHSNSEIWLHGGRIYIDAAGRKGLLVVTPNATITDTGTQFEVSVDAQRLEVATREGAVEVDLAGRRIRSRAQPGAGEMLRIDGAALLETSTLPTSGARWAWIQGSRPLFSVSGRSVREYLDWAAREDGRQLSFATPLSEQQAGLRQLGGTGAVDADADSVARVLATTAFELRPGTDHELVVALKADAE